LIYLLMLWGSSYWFGYFQGPVFLPSLIAFYFSLLRGVVGNHYSPFYLPIIPATTSSHLLVYRPPCYLD
jgi:hypothetical protein